MPCIIATEIPNDYVCRNIETLDSFLEFKVVF